MNKKSLLSLVAGLFSFSVFCEQFKISQVIYEIDGITKEYALKDAVPISTEKIFASHEELDTYLDDIRQQLSNERNLASSQVSVEYPEEDAEDSENAITSVKVRVLTHDSKHFLAMAYPKYSSNDGAFLKAKIKDTNFLGTMSDLEGGFNVGLKAGDEELGEDPDEYDKIIGFELSYNYPFPFQAVNLTWTNDFSVKYTFWETKPEYSLFTGLTLEIPFSNFSIVLEGKQGAVRNTDYEKYKDETYFVEYGRLSIPVAVADIQNWGKVIWRPYSKITYNWDSDGIRKRNEDLSSPLIRTGYRIETGRVNWIGNFRDGLTLDFDQNIGYNDQTDEYLPQIKGGVEAFKAFKHAGINARFFAMAQINGKEEVGQYLRGIKDGQRFNKNLSLYPKKSLKVKNALALNLDLPIHIFTSDWKMFDWMKIFNFELQVSPFFDAALTSNEATGKLFSPKDGWYAGGIEFLVFPQKWRSIVMRASCGFDLGKLILDKASDSYYDESWRSTFASSHELYIGLGLHY